MVRNKTKIGKYILPNSCWASAYTKTSTEEPLQTPTIDNLQSSNFLNSILHSLVIQRQIIVSITRRGATRSSLRTGKVLTMRARTKALISELRRLCKTWSVRIFLLDYRFNSTIWVVIIIIFICDFLKEFFKVLVFDLPLDMNGKDNIPYDSVLVIICENLKICRVCNYSQVVQFGLSFFWHVRLLICRSGGWLQMIQRVFRFIGSKKF